MNDKYLQYEITDFLTDDSFVNWVLDKTYDKEWQVWISKHPEITTRIVESKQLVGSVKFREDNAAVQSKSKVWNRIDQSTLAKEVTLNPNRRKVIYSLLAAAAVALLAVFLLPERATVIESQLAETKTLSLPANSSVILSESSSLAYKSDDWNSRRDVELKGQAHFKVSKGVPFIVSTSNGSVEVLGTEFDVISEQSSLQVHVTEGRVQVTSGNHSKILTAGMAFYKNPTWEDARAIPGDWATDNALVIFDDQPLSNVLSSITALNGSVFEYGNIDKTMSYTGSYDSSSELESILEKVLWPLRIKYSVENDIVILTY